jgi:hypothetical protein
VLTLHMVVHQHQRQLGTSLNERYRSIAPGVVDLRSRPAACLRFRAGRALVMVGLRLARSDGHGTDLLLPGSAAPINSAP